MRELIELDSSMKLLKFLEQDALESERNKRDINALVKEDLLGVDVYIADCIYKSIL